MKTIDTKSEANNSGSSIPPVESKDKPVNEPAPMTDEELEQLEKEKKRLYFLAH